MLNHPLPMSQKKDYEINENPVNLDKVFEVNDLSYDDKLEILELDVGESLAFGEKVLERVN